MPPKYYTPAQRVAAFWSKVEVGEPDCCWPWSGGETPKGYGRVWWEGRLIGAHRIAFFLSGGYLPIGKDVCHSCDNPPCCNPKHLFVGSRKKNVEDSQAKDRFIKGERVASAKLTESNVIGIRALYAAGKSYRELADLYGVHPITIKDAVLKKTWKHL